MCFVIVLLYQQKDYKIGQCHQGVIMKWPQDKNVVTYNRKFVHCNLRIVWKNLGFRMSVLHAECNTGGQSFLIDKLITWRMGLATSPFKIVRYSSFVHIRSKHVIYTWQVSLFSTDREPHRFEEHLQISPFFPSFLSITPDFLEKGGVFLLNHPLISLIDQQPARNLASTAIMTHI
mgnify:CR=1 FL=1